MDSSLPCLALIPGWCGLYEFYPALPFLALLPGCRMNGVLLPALSSIYLPCLALLPGWCRLNALNLALSACILT